MFILFVFRQAVAYFIYVLDKIVNRDYVIVYLHTLSSEENQPPLSFLKDIYHLVDNKLVLYYRCMFRFLSLFVMNLIKTQPWWRKLSWKESRETTYHSR